MCWVSHWELKIWLRSAAHPRLSNILSAQPKNYNRTLCEALIQSAVTMRSETKSAACSQHISSYAYISLSLSPFWQFSVLPFAAESFSVLCSHLLHSCLSHSAAEFLNILIKRTYFMGLPGKDTIRSVDLVDFATSFKKLHFYKELLKFLCYLCSTRKK